MISRLIALEQMRLKGLGYGSVVSPVSVRVATALVNLALGNDCYILTGIRPSDTDVAADTHTVTLASATDGLMATEREMSVMGQAVHKTFRSFLIITTVNNGTSDAFTATAAVPAYTLDFVRVSPVKTNSNPKS